MLKSFFKIFTIFPRNELRYCVLIVVCMVFGGVLEAVGIGAILPLISVMGQPDFLENNHVAMQCADLLHIRTHTELIVFMALGLVVLYVLKNTYLTWMINLQARFSMRQQVYYSNQLMASYLYKPYVYHLDHNSATLLRNVNSVGTAVFANILMPTFALMAETITAFAIWIMLVFVDAFTAILVAGFMGAMIYVVMKAFRRKIVRQGELQMAYASEYIKWVNQGLGAIKETKVTGKEGYFLDRFSEAYIVFGNAYRIFQVFVQTPKLLIESLVISSLLLLIVVKLLLGNAPMEIVPLLGVLALAAFRLMPSANRMVAISNSIKFQMPFFEELYDELIEIKARRSKENASVPPCGEAALSFNESIQISEVYFQYPHTERKILDGISLDFPKGAFVGVTGASGAGKTTFIDILLGLMKPDQGKIEVDGQDIWKNIDGWRNMLAYVPQSIYLIDGSIRENIALGISEDRIDDDHIERVLRMAELDTFVKELPDGVETEVGERGVKLSGGQRQRIGIARALYLNPQILVLDEATSALDSETEQNITDTILKLKGQITIIAVAHRTSTLESCDIRVHFSEGKAGYTA
mgnify:FL=1